MRRPEICAGKLGGAVDRRVCFVERQAYGCSGEVDGACM